MHKKCDEHTFHTIDSFEWEWVRLKCNCMRRMVNNYLVAQYYYASKKYLFNLPDYQICLVADLSVFFPVLDAPTNTVSQFLGKFWNKHKK